MAILCSDNVAPVSADSAQSLPPVFTIRTSAEFTSDAALPVDCSSDYASQLQREALVMVTNVNAAIGASICVGNGWSTDVTTASTAFNVQVDQVRKTDTYMYVLKNQRI